MLSEHDKTIDWRQLADGITTSGEQQQYTDGPSIGCLPDSFQLKTQTRRPWDINPCALVSLRMRLRGEQDGLAVATAGRWRVISPFPVKIDGDVAKLKGREGIPYQLVVFERESDGRPRIIDVLSRGEDAVPLGNECVSLFARRKDLPWSLFAPRKVVPFAEILWGASVE